LSRRKPHQIGYQNPANQSLRPVRIVENLASKLLPELVGPQNEQYFIAAGPVLQIDEK
jgi:hypothetical protein